MHPRISGDDSRRKLLAEVLHGNLFHSISKTTRPKEQLGLAPGAMKQDEVLQPCSKCNISNPPSALKGEGAVETCAESASRA